MNLRLDRAALKEFDAAARWYNRQRRGLGDELIEAISSAVNEILEDPLRFEVVPVDRTDRIVRRVPVERFPYSVYYEVSPDEVYVVAIAHAKRRSQYWRRRL